MAAAPMMTPRDRLQRMVDLGRKTLRYWWLVAMFAVVGGGLSFAFAVTRPRAYQSWATMFYQERIQSSLLSNREEQVQRNIGDRYRELLLARAQLINIIADKQLDPYPQINDDDLKIDKLRQAVHFEARGANAFRITYTDKDPDRAKGVTEKLTKLLQDKDEALRNEQAQATVAFAMQQKDEASADLRTKTLALTEFLAKNPEFAQDPNQPGSGEGASIRAIRNAKPESTGNRRLDALQRQRQRVEARLAANPNAPPIRVPVAQTPEKVAADAAVADAQRELASANRELEDALAKYTDKHPTAISAKERVAAAKDKLRRAQAAVPADVETTVAPTTEAERTRLKEELARLDSKIAQEQRRDGKTPDPAASDATTDHVVQIETQHADLRRAVAEASERVQSLADSVFRAQMDANQKLAEAGGRLSVVDPAFRPVQPSGPGKTIFLLAGMILFLSLGSALAIGLAVIDDRLYRRMDIDQLGLAVLAVIPPQRKLKRPPRRRGGPA